MSLREKAEEIARFYPIGQRRVDEKDHKWQANKIEAFVREAVLDERRRCAEICRKSVSMVHTTDGTPFLECNKTPLELEMEILKGTEE